MNSAPRGPTPEERRFALVLAALAALVLVGYRDSVLGPPLAGWSALTARAAFAVLRALAVPASLDGTILAHPGGFACEVYYRCTGFLPLVCLAVAILASPGRARRKLAGIALGAPLLLGLNLLRVVHVFIVGATRPDLFGLMHGVVWEAAIVAAVIGIWMVWRQSPRRVMPSRRLDRLQHGGSIRPCRR